MKRAIAGAALCVLTTLGGLRAAPVDEPAAAPAAEAAPAVALRYRAYLAGAPVGRATVRVWLGSDGYRVEGEAASEGWMDGVTRWRNRFRAEGDLVDATHQPAHFGYVETDRDKKRQVSVRDRILRVVKNGKIRPPQPAPPGADVLSALFVQPSCLPEQQVHTGRHVYRLTRLGDEDGVCRYRVVDDDDEFFEVAVNLIRRAGLMVPGRITFRGWVSGSIELADTDS